MSTSTTPVTTPAVSPLGQAHAELGASFTDFAGWSMPLRYASDLAEHKAVRTSAGLFDLSHMGEIRVTGPEAGRALDAALVGRPSAMAVGRAAYGMVVDHEGGIVDDLVTYRLGEEEFLVVANAANVEPVVVALADRARPFDAHVADETARWGLVAVQGPASVAIVAPLLDPARASTCRRCATTARSPRCWPGSRSCWPAPGTPVRTGSRCSSPSSARARCGTPCSPPPASTAGSPRAWPAATPSASRPGCRSTGTS